MVDGAVVHVIDDDLAIRQSLSFLLATDGLLVKLYESASAFLGALNANTAGCVVTDVRMPGIDGVELVRRLTARGSSLPVIVMTGHADVALAVASMKNGAFDFIEKPFMDTEFLSIVRAALKHAANQVIDSHLGIEVQERINLLSQRERQVLDGLVAGKANKVIALDLGISPRTVEIYRANVMTKMHANSLSELVRMSIASEQRGLS